MTMIHRRAFRAAMLACVFLCALPGVLGSAVTLPFRDTFDADSIADGTWSRFENAPVSSQIANGDLTLKRLNPAHGPGGGGIRREWPSVAAGVVLEANVTAKTVYRFGFGLEDAATGRNVILEADDLGWLLGYHTEFGRELAYLGVPVVPEIPYRARLTVWPDGRAVAELRDPTGVIPLARASTALSAYTTPVNADAVLLAVWRDNVFSPMSEYVVHDVTMWALVGAGPGGDGCEPPAMHHVCDPPVIDLPGD